MPSKNKVNGYSDQDVNRYFARGGSVIAFKDVKGRKRIAKVVSTEPGMVVYNVGLLSRTGYSGKKWKKRTNLFEPLMYKAKYIRIRDDVFYVYPSGVRTMQKGLSSNTHNIIHLNSGKTEVLDHPELHWEYLWGDEYADKNAQVTINGKKYLWGVQV